MSTATGWTHMNAWLELPRKSNWYQMLKGDSNEGLHRMLGRTRREPGMTVPEYDLVVIGSGPAGQKGAIAAAKAHKRVALIDRAVMMGGGSVHTGTIPSKTLREAIF